MDLDKKTSELTRSTSGTAFERALALLVEGVAELAGEAGGGVASAAAWRTVHALLALLVRVVAVRTDRVADVVERQTSGPAGDALALARPAARLARRVARHAPAHTDLQ